MKTSIMTIRTVRLNGRPIRGDQGIGSTCTRLGGCEAPVQVPVSVPV